MFCIQCGKQLPEGAKFCTSCGAPRYGSASAKAAAPEQKADAGCKAPEKGSEYLIGTRRGKQIAWRVLDLMDGTALMISREVIVTKPYHQPGGSVTWKDSELRQWLNGEFLNTCFTEEERACICMTDVSDTDNPQFHTPWGEPTADRLFLLSIREAEQLFPDYDSRKVKGSSWWWLRSPGHDAESAAFVHAAGDVNRHGTSAAGPLGVRPAFRIGFSGLEKLRENDSTQKKPETVQKTEKPDFTGLFDRESKYGQSYNMGTLTDEMIARAEQKIGYRMPASYLELLRFQNGGVIRDDDCWLTAIYGIGEIAEAENGLEDMFENWMDEWEYPRIGIPFGETQSGGHDLYFLDCRNPGADGEPPVVHVEAGDEPEQAEITEVTKNLYEFLNKVLAGEITESD